MQAVRFIAVGDVMFDVVAEGSGHDAMVGVYAGGSAANAAVWAAALGADATVVGRVGDDMTGRMVRSELEARGVRAELSVDPDTPTGIFLLVDGEPRADRGANANFMPEHLPKLEADAVLISGYLPRPTVEAALADAQARWVALDAARLEDLPPGGNVVLANEATARALGVETEDPIPPREAGYEFVVVTRGSRGAIATTKDSVIRAVPPETVSGDPVGVGDAFAAALLVSLARGSDGDHAMANACAVAADAAKRMWPT
jgi:sugar/nucleoside kinase (ribokinase family)